MSRRLVLAAGAAAALLVGPVLAFAWDATGHETVARIAWERMTPAARARAVQLLRSAPADAGLRELDDSTRPGEVRDRELFMRAAAWADMVRDRNHPERAKKYHHGPWHYRDAFWEQDSAGAPIKDRPDIEPSPKGENAVAQLAAAEAGLMDRSRPDSLRAIDLAWLIHLVGDIHQPLHASARITPRDPGGDAGGNRFRLDSAGKTNLHAYWDDAITREWPRGAADSTLDAYIGRVAAGVTRAYPPTRFASQLEPDAFDAWATASVAIAKRDLYPTTLVRDRTPPDSYRARAKAIAEPAVALAGYRLAEVLNRVLR
jgi:hypothetical protein